MRFTKESEGVWGESGVKLFFFELVSHRAKAGLASSNQQDFSSLLEFAIKIFFSSFHFGLN